MSEFSDEMQQVAIDLITEYGEPIVLQRTIEGGYDPGSSGGTGEEIIIDYSAYCCPLNYSALEVDGTTILMRDRRLLMNKAQEEPLVGDVATVGGIVYRVMNVNKEVVNGEDIYYDLQVRV